ncbi:hypothetical protein GUITHDRAFT_105904 [Guillardia theta CCMP2712]|uniref:J domain-containing protein n=1 Tax=Guillardia theta (strain CCMP2712) TaxID=905079 RepID=L1JJ31_GUITC|nr:hypothetical protein GUITHDRAFT_105904 [Guillardia theta CCMP2712]EKX48297.1 hypothetical protein GUITHDRAFT_105904 [Guillardia theta CCMP2712]|eukprot:XP_005835277.1 hypothetical protein GUITHDRAFT_105904 [Guillardia theta CCMP2712]
MRRTLLILLASVALSADICSGFVSTPRFGLSPQVSQSGRCASLAATKTKKKDSKPASGGFGKAAKSATTTIDPAILSRYVVSIRMPKAGTLPAGYEQLSDWVPTAVMAIRWVGDSLEGNPILQGMADANLIAPLVVKKMCREIWECACQGSPSLRRLPRNFIEYAYEPLDNFGDVMEEVNSKKDDVQRAYQTLGLAKGASAAEVKAAHRKLIVTLHPDRTSSLPDDEKLAAEERFRQVQSAYECLGGGMGDSTQSWYENLGGKARKDFCGPVQFANVPSEDLLEFWDFAVCPLETEISQNFIMRNMMRKE